MVRLGILAQREMVQDGLATILSPFLWVQWVHIPHDPRLTSEKRWIWEKSTGCGAGAFMTNCTLFTNHWEVCQQHWDVRLLLATGAWKFGEFTKYDHRLVDDLFVPREFELYDIYIYIHHILHTYIYIYGKVATYIFLCQDSTRCVCCFVITILCCIVKTC